MSSARTAAPTRAQEADRQAEVPALFRRSLYLNERSTADLTGPEARVKGEPKAVAWRESSGADSEAFDLRLASAGLDWQRFACLLAAHQAALPPVPLDRSSLAWYRVIEQIRNGVHDQVELPATRWNNPDGSVGTEPPFSSFLRPFLKAGVGRFRSGLADLEGGLFEVGERAAEPLITPPVETKFMLGLVELLTKQCSGTLILELNVARLRGQLQGATPNERFRYFSERHFTTARVLELLEEYPVLARLLSMTVERWAASSLEFLARLAADRDRLTRLTAAPTGFTTLRSVELGVGDLHRGGRSVVIAEDVLGNKVVYKPTALGIDAEMKRLVEKINGFGPRYRLSTVDLVDRGSYGWQAFVERAACDSGEALGRFYWRQGAWIAVLHLVRGADFHSENLIAHGEHPILVDNEAMFHQVPPSGGGAETAREHAVGELRQAVIRQAILPFIYRLSATGEGVDSSGLGGAGGQVARGTARRWSDPGTDQMRVEDADMVTQGAKNLPSLDGEKIDASDFLPEIVRGFEETYDLLAGHRHQLRPLLDRFAGHDVRFLVRPTRTYAVFLREGHHPNDLRDGLERDQLLDRLWAVSALSSKLAPVIPFEHEDLRSGDIPVFFSRPDSRHLWASSGERVDDFFDRPCLEEAHSVLDGLSEEDRRRQVLLIRLSLSEAGHRAGRRAPTGTCDQPAVQASESPDPAALEGAARGIGRELERRSLASDRGTCFISLDPFLDDQPGGDKLRDIAIARSDLYHGGAGIALFLAYLGRLTGAQEFTDLARGAMGTVLEARAATGVMANRALGAYAGRTSYCYVLQHLAELWQESRWLEEALADLPTLESLVAEDQELDMLSGSAGCAIVMLRLYAATGEAAALRVARACGDHLLSKAEPCHGGVGWTGNSFSGPVVGFAHGAAGIAWALLELAHTTGDQRYRQAALDGIAFERNLLASGEGDSFRSRISWCHGLPSVALGRIQASARVDDPFFATEIEAGMQRILGPGGPTDACLCHGVLGNAEILARAGEHSDVAAWRDTAMRWAAGTARDTRAQSSQLFLPLHARFAGLFCGLAGIGWQLLRFAHRHRMPSVLTLDPPPATGP